MPATLSPKAAGALTSAPIGVIAVYVLAKLGVDLPAEVVAAGTGVIATVGAYIARDGLRAIGERVMNGASRNATNGQNP